MTCAGITLSFNDVVTIKAALGCEADRLKEALDNLKGTDTESVAMSLYKDIMDAIEHFESECDAANERRWTTCEVKSLEES